MANQKQLAVLRQGPDAWNAWRVINLDTSPELKRAGLSGVELMRADLSKANLTGANLSGSNLTQANLNGANLIRADLQGAYLGKASLREVDLTEALLTGADLDRADLRGACLRRANLTGVDLTGVDLRESILDGTNLTRANLTRANLTGVNLTGVNLSGVLLTGTDLTGVVLDGSILSDRFLFCANTSDVAMKGRFICTSTERDEDPLGIYKIRTAKNRFVAFPPQGRVSSVRKIPGLGTLSSAKIRKNRIFEQSKTPPRALDIYISEDADPELVTQLYLQLDALYCKKGGSGLKFVRSESGTLSPLECEVPI